MFTNQIKRIFAIKTVLVNSLLKDISIEIFSGQAFAGRIENNPEGDCHVVQLRDLNDSYTNIERMPHLVNSGTIPYKQFLKKGDLLFITKGSNNFALIFDKDYKAVASTIFFVIRPEPTIVNSKYLEWYINQSPAQEYLHAGKEGSSVTNINKNTLEHLPINIPPMELQRKIAGLYELLQKEIYLTEAILEKRQLFIEKLLLTQLKQTQ